MSETEQTKEYSAQLKQILKDSNLSPDKKSDVLIGAISGLSPAAAEQANMAAGGAFLPILLKLLVEFLPILLSILDKDD